MQWLVVALCEATFLYAHAQPLCAQPSATPFQAFQEASQEGASRVASNTAYLRADSIREDITRYNEEHRSGPFEQNPSNIWAHDPKFYFYRN